MPKSKNTNKEKKKLDRGQSSMEAARDNPSEACKNFLIEFIVKFYEAETTMSLDSKYVRYQEQCVEKFKSDMIQKMLDALSTPLWDQDRAKKNFNKLIENKAHDALWNSKDVITKYGTERRIVDDAFQDIILKADLFVKRCKPFAKARNRRGSVGWWNGPDGIAEIESRRQHLIALPDTVRVIPQDGIVLKGGYATIRRVRIEGCPGILPYWEFAAKLSNHHRTQPRLAKLEHQNESMAVRIPHPGVIRFNAVHATRNEGYSYWWNGGTLRRMLFLDRDYPDDIHIRLLHPNTTEKQFEEAHQLARFRKKRTELAWAFLHIMNAVHLAKYRHNDISIDNIMLHFPQDESKVFIGVCDWGMATVDSEEVKSLYTFTSEGERQKTLRERWWLDPSIAYLHQKDADVEIIPTLSRESEQYAVAKIAERINMECMSKEYAQLQREKPTMSKLSDQDLVQIFHTYLKQLYDKGIPNGTLSHFVTRFTNTYNWPVPDEHFRHSY